MLKKLILALLLVSCLISPMVSQSKPFKVAFVYVGSPGDMGWTFEHDQGRKAVEKEFGSKVQTTFIENVPEGPDAERVIRQFALDGYNMIFTTSFGFMDATINVAKEFPNVIFEHCSGYKTAPNVATYFGRIEEVNFLTGMLAGKATKNNKIGFVGAFAIPEVIRNVNWFTLGARSVNPKATVTVVWTNTWYNPVKEREAAIALLDSGVDFIGQDQDTTEPQSAAKERGMMSTGYNSDMMKFVGDSVLGSSVWNWGVYYKDQVKKAMLGTWKTHAYWEGLNDNVVFLSALSPKVPKDVAALVEKTKKDIISGKFNIYAGPIKDQTGKIIVPAGKAMTLDERANMSWLVEGVIGKVQ